MNSESHADDKRIVIDLGQFVDAESTQIKGSALGWHVREQSDIDTKVDELLQNGNDIGITFKVPVEVDTIETDFLVTFLDHAMRMVASNTGLDTFKFESDNPHFNPNSSLYKAAVSILFNPVPLLTDKQRQQQYNNL